MGAEAERSGSAPRLALAGDVAGVRELFREYADSLEEHKPYLVGFDEEVAALPDGYDCIILVDGAGCVALRRLDEHACEMKRLYVRPSARGRGAGRALAVALIEHSRERGYSVMRLDTLPSMTEAGPLYRSLGFVEVERYTRQPGTGRPIHGARPAS